MAKMLVIYYSRTGHTKKMAECIYDELKGLNAEVDMVNVTDVDINDITSYDAFIIGSPNYFGTMAGEIKDFFDKSVKHYRKLSGKIAAAFTSEGMIGGGGDTVVLDILKSCLVHGMVVQGYTEIGHYGPVAIGDPDKRSLDECKILAKNTYDLIKRLFG
jgi:NAD(P)H dehydrogenase (quinone)